MADSLIVEFHSHSAYYSEYLCVTCRVQVTCNTVNPVCTILDFWTLNFQVTVISTIIAQNVAVMLYGPSQKLCEKETLAVLFKLGSDGSRYFNCIQSIPYPICRILTNFSFYKILHRVLSQCKASNFSLGE